MYSITKCGILICMDIGCDSFCDYDDLILEDLKSTHPTAIGKDTFETISSIDTRDNEVNENKRLRH